MEEAEGEKSVDKYDSEDDKRLIESLELHIGSLTRNGKGETATAVTQGGSPSVDASEEPEGKHLDEGSENVDKGIVSDSSGNSSRPGGGASPRGELTPRSGAVSGID